MWDLNSGSASSLFTHMHVFYMTVCDGSPSEVEVTRLPDPLIGSMLDPS